MQIEYARGIHPKVKKELRTKGFMLGAGGWAVVDGQYGSTGKGLLSGALAEAMPDRVDVVTSNAGPNSGHTAYANGKKIVLKQLPMFPIVSKILHGTRSPIYLNAGAIIDGETLYSEIVEYGLSEGDICLNPFAAMISDTDKNTEKSLVSKVGSTGKGTGSALANKILRVPGSVVGDHDWNKMPGLLGVMNLNHSARIGDRILIEVSQGYSLSLNSGGFWPFCTSRDCTVAQAVSDAGLHPHFYRGCAMVVRTFPIRVAGNSGPVYPDQEELTWDELGQTPELTTVTQKIRRVFTWSKRQFADAMMANRPAVLLVNFMNYLGGENPGEWLEENVVKVCRAHVGYVPQILTGWGPNSSDLEVYHA